MKILSGFCLIIIFSCSPANKKDSLSEWQNIWADKFVQRYKNNFYSNKLNEEVSKSLLLKTDEFSLSISNNPIDFNVQQKVIYNPNFQKDYEKDDQQKRNYPISYSGIFEDKLISLFDNGNFSCFDLNTLEVDEHFTKKLNTKKFNYHWISRGELIAKSENTFYKWKNDDWIKIDNELPVYNQPILFEDNQYIIFSDCHGEWGGTIYFYNKKKNEIFYTEATCANTIKKENGNYLILSSLGHMMGNSYLKLVRNPTQLSKINSENINQTFNGEALGYKDDSNAFEIKFNFYDIILFSNFRVDNRELYLTHLNDQTFIAEIENREIQIVHPFLESDIYTHNPVTTQYGDYVLINLDFYGTAFEREVSVIIIKNNNILKLDWNEYQSD